MADIGKIPFCPRLGLPRVDNGCLHCTWSLKIGNLWWCFYDEDEHIRKAVER